MIIDKHSDTWSDQLKLIYFSVTLVAVFGVLACSQDIRLGLDLTSGPTAIAYEAAQGNSDEVYSPDDVFRHLTRALAATAELRGEKKPKSGRTLDISRSDFHQFSAGGPGLLADKDALHQPVSDTGTDAARAPPLRALFS